MAAAVIVIAIAVITLAAMVGVGGYALGCARVGAAEAKSDENLHETLVHCKGKALIVSDLLSFETEQAEQYRAIAIGAIAAIPEGDPHKKVYKTSLDRVDERLENKLQEVNGGALKTR